MTGLSVRAAGREAGGLPALVFGDRVWTWAELAADVEHEIAELIGRGVCGGPEGRPLVALDATAEPRTVARLLALIEIGTPFVPLHPSLTERERAHQLSTVEPCLDLDRSAGTPEVRREAGGPVMPGDPLAVLFTSGATGAPRAVRLSRASFRGAAAASASRLGWNDRDRWLVCLPLAHVGGLSIVTRCLIARRPVVLAPGFEPASVAEAIGRHSVTLISLVPTMLTRLLQLQPEWRPPPSLRVVLLGGGPVPDAVWQQAERRGVPLRATYGLTETCSQVATGTAAAPRALVPLDGISVRIVDGSIEVRAPYLEHDGYVRTGDLGDLGPDGVLEVFGRADELIITGGENVMPQGVESELEAHPRISRAVVFGHPDDEWGEVVAAALVADGPPLDHADLKRWCEERLAPFRRPRRVTWLERLPETPTGKVDRLAVIAATAGRLEALS